MNGSEAVTFDVLGSFGTTNVDAKFCVVINVQLFLCATRKEAESIDAIILRFHKFVEASGRFDN